MKIQIEREKGVEMESLQIMRERLFDILSIAGALMPWLMVTYFGG